MTEKLLTLDQAQSQLWDTGIRVTIWSLYHWVRNNTLPCRKVAGRWYITQLDLDKFITGRLVDNLVKEVENDTPREPNPKSLQPGPDTTTGHSLCGGR
jgi:hypothetical protein